MSEKEDETTETLRTPATIGKALKERALSGFYEVKKLFEAVDNRDLTVQLQAEEYMAVLRTLDYQGLRGITQGVVLMTVRDNEVREKIIQSASGLATLLVAAIKDADTVPAGETDIPGGKYSADRLSCLATLQAYRDALGDRSFVAYIQAVLPLASAAYER